MHPLKLVIQMLPWIEAQNLRDVINYLDMNQPYLLRKEETNPESMLGEQIYQNSPDNQ